MVRTPYGNRLYGVLRPLSKKSEWMGDWMDTKAGHAVADYAVSGGYADMRFFRICGYPHTLCGFFYAVSCGYAHINPHKPQTHMCI